MLKTSLKIKKIQLLREDLFRKFVIQHIKYQNNHY